MSSRRVLLPLLAALALLALGAALGFQKIRTFDYWWHLRTGQLIVETGSVPSADPYTYTVPGARWIDIHWLFQLGLHGLQRVAGHDGVVVAKVLAVWGLIAILATIGFRRERPWVCALPLGLMLLVAGDRFMPRPELPSFLLLAGVLALLDRYERKGGRGVYAIVALQLLWANVHGLFALGIAVCAMAVAAEVLRPLVMPGAELRRDRVLHLSLVTALSVAATAINPNGIDGLLYPIQQLQMVGPADERGLFGSLIAELIPPLSSERALNPVAMTLVGSLAVLSFGSIVLNWRHASSFDPLAWVAFLYLALGAQRNIALFAIVAAAVAMRNLNAFLERNPLPSGAHVAATGLVAAGLSLGAWDVASDRFFFRIGSFREAGLGPFDFYYPVGATAWIERERPPGPICHHMADGGYLIHELWPDYPVMVDGRLEVFGPETFAGLQVASTDRFRELDAEHQFGVVVVHYSLLESRDFLYWLYYNPNWRMVHVDDTAALFVRQSDERRWPEVDLDDPELFPPLGDGPGPGDRVRRQARVNFYASLRRYEAALALWEETLERYPDLPQGPVIHAHLLQQTGFPAAAEALLRRELERRPDDPKLLTQVGDLRQEAGDPEAARAMYERALDLEPNNAYALLRLGLLAEADGDPETAAYHYARILTTAPSPSHPTAVAARSRLARLGEPSL
ncbi:MAG: tetratricopeptide repeat protein [Myxococcota bacterium]|nr:tetratricopeptide repeat protein [Myxococcota bacterium]